LASNRQPDDTQGPEAPASEPIEGHIDQSDSEGTEVKSDNMPSFTVSSDLTPLMEAVRSVKAVNANSSLFKAFQNDRSVFSEWKSAAARLNEVYGGIDSSFVRLRESMKALDNVRASVAPIARMTPSQPNFDATDITKMLRNQQEAEQNRRVDAIKEGIESSPLADALRIQFTELENITHGLQTANELLTTQVGTLVEHLEQARTTSEQQAKANRFQVWLAISIAFGTLAAATGVQLWLSSQSASNDQAAVQLLQTIVNLLGTK